MDSEIKKAKEKAMSLLLVKDRTETELTNRLYKAGFSEKAIKEAINYTESFGYINDTRYAANYIHFYKESKSRKEILYKLKQKGIAGEILEEAFDDYESDRETLRHIIQKRMKGEEISTLDKNRKQKLIAYLARKGFSIHDILSEIGD